MVEKKAGRVSRVVDVVAEWLLPDPTAHAERALREYREFLAREQGKQGPEEKTPPKG